MGGLILLIIGLVLVIRGAGWLVDAATALARRAGISDLAVGLTVVAFGTSLPELAVNIFASVDGNAAITIGNITGSNIANILLILGLSALIFPLEVGKGTIWKEIPFSLLAAAIWLMRAEAAGSREPCFSKRRLVLLYFVILLYYMPMPAAYKSIQSRPMTKRSLSNLVWSGL